MPNPYQRTTPWGKPDDCRVIADGILFYSTPSHGGYWISPERRKAMPPEWRNYKTFAGGNWFEEDCDWAVVCLSFPEHFPPAAGDVAEAVARQYCRNR